MDAMQAWRVAVTRSLAGSIVLAAALVIHIALNIWKIGRRSTWRLPFWEAAQILLGLTIPALLFVHLAQMRGHYIMLDQATRYSETLPDLWGKYEWRQMALLVVVWVHSCIGLHFWLRLSPLYRRVLPVLFGLAVLIPTLSLAGFVVAGRDAVEIAAASPAAAAPPGYVEDGYGGYEYAAPAAEPLISDPVLEAGASYIAWALIGIVLIAIGIRALIRRGGRRIRISYAAGPSFVASAGPTLLELSRMAGVPHAAVCGGRARCSTCRVRIEESEGALPAPNAAEAATLKQIHAGPGHPPRLPAPPAAQPDRHAHAPPSGGTARRAAGRRGGRRRARAGDPLPRHPRLHLDQRGAPALRHGVPAQPLLRRGRRGDQCGGRLDRQIHGRRDDGAVRRQPAAGSGMPLGAHRRHCASTRRWSG